jgi:hypothetical protein
MEGCPESRSVRGRRAMLVGVVSEALALYGVAAPHTSWLLPLPSHQAWRPAGRYCLAPWSSDGCISGGWSSSGSDGPDL